LVPQADVLVALAVLVLVLVGEVAAELVAGALVVGAVVDVVEEVELQAASNPRESAASAAAPVRVRQRTDLFICSAFSWLTASDFFGTSARIAFQPTRSPGVARQKKSRWTGAADPHVYRCSFALLCDVACNPSSHRVFVFLQNYDQPGLTFRASVENGFITVRPLGWHLLIVTRAHGVAKVSHRTGVACVTVRDPVTGDDRTPP